MIGRDTLKFFSVKNTDEYWEHCRKSAKSGTFKSADWMFDKGNPKQKTSFLLSIIDDDRELFIHFLKTMK
jgi:hypothetical protein